MTPIHRNLLSPASFLVLVAAVTVHGPAAAQQAQHHLYTVSGAANGDRFGLAVGGMADVDKDGVPEFFVGADLAGSAAGEVRVFRGATGTLLATVSGAKADDQYGRAAADAGDVNKDGWTDLVVGAPGPSTVGGYAEVVSGLWLHTKAGKRALYTFTGKASGDHYGFSVSGAGDVDKDGHADVLIGSRPDLGAGGYVELRSGKTGGVLRTYPAGTGVNNFGQSVSNAGDVDNDGYDDAIVGAASFFRVLSGKDGKTLHEARNLGGKSVSGAGDVNNDNHDDVMVFDGWTLPRRAVRVFSGKDWTVLHTFLAGPASPHTTFQSAVGDVNGDGHDDVLVQNGGSPLYPVVLYSGKDGKALLSLTGPATFGHSVRGIGDIDGDKIPDLIVGASGSATSPGSAHVYASSALSLATDVHEMTLAQGGKQSLRVAAGAAHANRSYWVFGSLTGTAPGIDLLGVHIPLNPDLYTDLAIGLTNSGPFGSFRGTLDGSGNATATLTIPASLPPTALVLHHAFVVFDAQGLFYRASRAAPLTLR